jgi:dTDP-4-dehydrorhamnose 3,5-epimerase
MHCEPTSIPDLHVAVSSPYTDERGTFSRLFCSQALTQVVGSRKIVQINYSRTTRKGAVRGLHFQKPPFSEMKLVRCLRGRIWDIAIDLRPKSKMFQRWHAQELSPDNGLIMIIPEGFGHGFQALEPESEIVYFHTAFYTPEAEGGVRFDDPKLSINWPLKITDVSDRDLSLPFIDDRFEGINT